MKKLKYIKLFENYNPDDLVKIKQLLLSDELSNVKLGLTMLSQTGQVKEAMADIEEEFIQNLKNFRKSDILEMRELFVDEREFTIDNYDEFVEYITPFDVKWSIHRYQRYVICPEVLLTMSGGSLVVYQTVFNSQSKKLILSVPVPPNDSNLIVFNDNNYVTLKK